MPAVSRRCRRLAGRELRQPLEWSRQGATVLAIERAGRLVGLIRVVREMDPLAEAVVARARAARSVRLAGKGSRLEQRLHVDGVVPGGSRLLSSIRELQQAGRCVALVSARPGNALAAADIGVGLTRNGRPPWGAHVLGGHTLSDVSLLLDALAVARQVSVRGLQLSAAAAVLTAALGALGRSAATQRRAALPMPIATVSGLALGTWYGLTVAAGRLRPRRIGRRGTPCRRRPCCGCCAPPSRAWT